LSELRDLENPERAYVTFSHVMLAMNATNARPHVAVAAQQRQGTFLHRFARIKRIVDDGDARHGAWIRGMTRPY
jgi:hypothetical protein